MDINSLFKYGSVVDVIVRFFSARTINNISYLVNEPYTILKGIDCRFLYSGENASAAARGNLIDVNTEYPDRIILKNVPLSIKITNLLFTKKSGVKKTYKGFFTPDVEKSIILPHNSCYNIFIYKDNVLIETRQELISNELNSNEFIAGEEYLVFYEYFVSTENNYSLKTPHSAYFTLEVFGQGNTDDETGDLYLKLEKCSLLTNKTMNFSAGSNTVDLVFSIIKDGEDYLVID